MKLNAATAQDLMRAGRFSIPEAATVEEVAAFLTDRCVGAAVVVDKAGRPAGVVAKSDLVIHLRERPAGASGVPATAGDVMTEAVFSVRDDAPARAVVEQLLGLNVSHLFVVEQAGEVIGVISPTDVLRRLA